jgi:hypothetical protein
MKKKPEPWEDVLDIFNTGSLGPLAAAALLVYSITRAIHADARGRSLRRYAAGLGALGFAAQAWYALRPSDSEDLLGLVTRSVLVAGFAYGLAALLGPLSGNLARAWHSARKAAGRWATARDRKRRERQEALRRELEKQRRRAEEERDRPAWEERLRREEEARRRRREARAACELLYDLHAPEVGPRLPRERFAALMQRWLTDDLDADAFERKAQQLQQLVLQHLHRIEPPPRRTAVADVQRWYERERAELDALPEGDLKDSLLAVLNGKFQERMFEALEASP